MKNEIKNIPFRTASNIKITMKYYFISTRMLQWKQILVYPYNEIILSNKTRRRKKLLIHTTRTSFKDVILREKSWHTRIDSIWFLTGKTNLWNRNQISAWLWGGGWLQRETKELSEEIKIVYTLAWVMVKQMQAFVKKHLSVHWNIWLLYGYYTSTNNFLKSWLSGSSSHHTSPFPFHQAALVAKNQLKVPLGMTQRL